MVLFLSPVLTTVLFSQRDRRWKLADFGTASQATSKRLNTTNFARGTSSYRAPEILLEDSRYNNKADIFALGCIICEVATRRRLFLGDISVWDYAARRAPLVARIWPECVLGSSMHWLGRLADELLEIDPTKRPGATEVAKRLQMMPARAHRSTQRSVEGDNFVPQIPMSHEPADIGDNGPDPFEPVFTRVYNQGDPGLGIGGYDLRSQDDRAFAFDYLHSGSPDHLVLYRPGTIYILKNSNGNFERVYPRGDQGNGIGGYDLAHPQDRLCAFDYEHSGKLDYLVAYRPGTGTIWILRNKDGEFCPVFQESCAGDGIAGFPLLDHVFAFDYDHSGCQDHLVFHSGGRAFILKIQNGQFIKVSTLTEEGVISAIDYNHSGRVDHIVSWNGHHILQNNQGVFTPVPMQLDQGLVEWTPTRILPYDYDGTGKADHLVFYLPGTGRIMILRNKSGKFSAVYDQTNDRSGIGVYDLRSSRDRIFPFAYFPKGKASELCLYRPGTGTFWILRRF